jgi:hypothetical protein
MNISIDEKVLENFCIRYDKKLTMPELLCCLAIKVGGTPNVMRDLVDNFILVKDRTNPDIWYVHSDYLDLINDVLTESKDIAGSTSTLTELVTKLQELFPKERKPDSNGVPKYAYRGNKRDVTERLQKFFKLYGKYSYDDVLECTRRYVESFKYDKTYMKILPYYIMKDGESQLATELENMDSNDSAIIPETKDWTNKLV